MFKTASNEEWHVKLSSSCSTKVWTDYSAKLREIAAVALERYASHYASNCRT